MKHNISQARKAFYSLLRNCKEKFIPLDCQIDLFLKTIDPILLYGSEIYGIDNCEMLEKFRLQCLKTLLKLRSSTPSYMIWAETGAFPLQAEIKKRIMGQWYRLINDDSTKTSTRLYYIALKHASINNSFIFKWSEKVKSILEETGLNYIWMQHSISKSECSLLKSRISDQALQLCKSGQEESMKKKSYFNMKTNWKIDNYLKCLPQKLYQPVLNLKTSNHRLPVEIGRHNNIQYINRTCSLCSSIGDEYHYVMECPQFKEQRKKLLSPEFIKKPSYANFIKLFNCDNPSVLKKLSHFISIIFRNLC